MKDAPTGHVAWKNVGGRRCLVVVFPDRVGTPVAQDLIQRMTDLLETADGPIPLVWDCRQMESYSPQAFAVWRDRLPELASRLDGICCLTGSTFIRMGARALGLAIRMSIATCGSETEVHWD